MKKRLFLIAIIIIHFGACKEFIEPSLEYRKLSLLSPGDSLETNSYKQTFWWEGTDDALSYRLQIVSPGFDSISSLIVDTTINDDKFIYTVDPGRYEWRVRAQNGSSFSQYFKRSFIVYPSELKSQQVQLVRPANTLLTSNENLILEWQKLFGAIRYRVQLDTNSFADSTNLVLNTLTAQLSSSQRLKNDARYAFRVRAENDSQLSKWSEIRYFQFDSSPPPDEVMLTEPQDKMYVTKPVKLKWTSQVEADRYELVIFKNDSSTPISGYPVFTTSNVATFSTGEINDRISWRVRAVDKAGNKGAFSKTFSFIVRE